MYAASSVGSFLDTVLPGRMGEASKVAVLKVASGPRWPGFSRAGGSLLCAHLLEMVAFVLVGAASGVLPAGARRGRRSRCSSGSRSLPAGLVVASLVHHRLGHRLPESVGSFLAGAAAPAPVMLRAGPDPRAHLGSRAGSESSSC
jgi:hypothetical protein